jgi:hypothetical protein
LQPFVTAATEPLEAGFAVDGQALAANATQLTLRLDRYGMLRLGPWQTTITVPTADDTP